jgi:hypothetical protein
LVLRKATRRSHSAPSVSCTSFCVASSGPSRSSFLEGNHREQSVEQPTEVELDIAPVVDLESVLETVDERPVFTRVRIERPDEISRPARSRDQESSDDARCNPRASHVSPLGAHTIIPRTMARGNVVRVVSCNGCASHLLPKKRRSEEWPITSS